MDSAEYERRVTEWLATKFTEPRDCPVCATNSWTFGSPVELTVRARDVEGTEDGRALPVCPFVCNNCGYVRLISTVMAGIIAPDDASMEAREGNAS